MPSTIRTKIYKFNELSDSGKNMIIGTGGDLSLINYRQNQDGKFIGHNSNSCFQTRKKFEMGESPESFKYEIFEKATTEQSSWYLILESSSRMEQDIRRRLMIEQHLEDGGSLSDF